MKSLVLWVIQAYQYLLSPLLGNRCRYEPSCSVYMMDAIKLHGIPKGLWMGGQRLCRCHPLAKGGVDPVPTKNSSTKFDKPRNEL